MYFAWLLFKTSKHPQVHLIPSIGSCGEGCILRNEEERFMECYTPTMKDLASRDASRFMTMEICEGCDVAMFNNQLQLNYQRLLFICPC
uniref:Uncharacterized protein n=2 Tax=Helianthus annuus TaxID=4232 RepID=A0A251S183_HELAN